jgi:uncharacterized membrane protein YphA (DoxX/SURF4 family)
MPKSSSSRDSWGLFLLRFIVGWVFLTEGIQKFLYPASLGAASPGAPFALIAHEWAPTSEPAPTP